MKKSIANAIVKFVNNATRPERKCECENMIYVADDNGYICMIIPKSEYKTACEMTGTEPYEFPVQRVRPYYVMGILNDYEYYEKIDRVCNVDMEDEQRFYEFEFNKYSGRSSRYNTVKTHIIIDNNNVKHCVNQKYFKDAKRVSGKNSTVNVIDDSAAKPVRFKSDEVTMFVMPIRMPN